MKIIITGGAGFLGQRLAKRLLDVHGPSLRLRLIDRMQTSAFSGDERVQSVECDVADASAMERLVDKDTAAIFHLAAIVSGQAEAEFDLGIRINLDATRGLLEISRRLATPPKFIFTSSVAVFGGELPDMVTDLTAVRPQSSYGAQKAMGELLVNDYSRKGFVDGRVLRLPTISVRPGAPNRAASSFVSGIIREPLTGEPAACPVTPDVRLWLSSPAAAVENLVHALSIPAASMKGNRTINLPGLSVTVGEMIETLKRVTGAEVAGRIRFERDESIERIVASWPRRFDTARALALGFQGDNNFESVVENNRREAFSSVP